MTTLRTRMHNVLTSDPAFLRDPIDFDAAYAAVVGVLADSLDDAWAEAEAALPEGWMLFGVTRSDRDEDGSEYVDPADPWAASAGRGDAAGLVRERRTSIGPTAADALHALAALWGNR